MVIKFPNSFTCKMDLQQQAVKLSKEIEKLTAVLTDGTALTQAQRTAKREQTKYISCTVSSTSEPAPACEVSMYLPRGTGVKPPSGFV